MSKQNNNAKYWLGFSKIEGIGKAKLEKLIHFFGNIENAWHAPNNELMSSGLDAKSIEQMIIKRPVINLDQELEKMHTEDIKFLTLEDDDYPRLLKEIYSPPLAIYYKGEFVPEKDEFSLGVVGTRKMTDYAKQITPKITRELTEQGLVIVSGLALGIDALAHEACLEAKGRTIAVLGSGLDKENIYPSYNRYLAEKILNNGGTLISEYAPGIPPSKFTFPQRNRIISGLSLGSLIVEAPEGSGALLTAKFAIDQNREVFAIPGSILSPNSVGPNNLIKQGAKAVANALDVLEALDLNLVKNYIETKKIVADSPQEQIILDNLTHEPIHVDELSRLTNLDTSVINSTLTLMEMKGRIRNLGAMMYVLG